MNGFYILLGLIVGFIYFYIMEWSVPRESNCSYISNIWTDILAFVYGLIIIYFGYSCKKHILLFLGTTIITEHILQFYRYKFNRIVDVFHI